MVKAFIAAGLIVAAGAGCKPSLDDGVSIVTTPRVLAVRSELVVANAATMTAPAAPPEAEAKVTERVTLTALYVDMDGAGQVTPSPLDWAMCHDRKPLAELGPVNPSCLAAAGAGLTPLGTGSVVMGVIPTDACQQFGSETPQPQAGQPPGRPVDPDPSGGYYLPMRLWDPSTGSLTLAETRIQCILASASADLRAAYQQRYHRNVNPEIASVGVKGAAPWIVADAGGAANVVAAGQRLALEVTWPSCPTTDVAADGVCGPDEIGTSCGTCGSDVGLSPGDCCVDANCAHARGCAGAERYVSLDPLSRQLVDRREAMAVAWFATGGVFDFDRAGRKGDDVAVTSENVWRAPSAAGRVTMWVVLRDERGGVGWKQVALDIQ